MIDGSGTGPLMGAWIGIWDVVADSPDVTTALVAVFFIMAMAGAALAVFGSGERQEQPTPVPVVVQARRPSRRARRRR